MGQERSEIQGGIELNRSMNLVPDPVEPFEVDRESLRKLYECQLLRRGRSGVAGGTSVRIRSGKRIDGSVCLESPENRGGQLER